MVVGRGLGFAVALEAALKLKETCAIQAEAFSGAEIRHGPLALVEHGYPLVIFALRGAEQAGLVTLARDLRQRGARVILAAPSGVADRDLTLEVGDDPTLDPILAIQTFYVLAARLAKARGLNPDEPPHLSKVTLTH
jgi:glucosamine--fructose-6-phosphate aminotransferase (isomerizing)